MFAEELAETAQNLVAVVVAERVIELLEVVEVENGQRIAMFQSVEHQVCLAAVSEPREVIGDVGLGESVDRRLTLGVGALDLCGPSGERLAHENGDRDGDRD